MKRTIELDVNNEIMDTLMEAVLEDQASTVLSVLRDTVFQLAKKETAVSWINLMEAVKDLEAYMHIIEYTTGGYWNFADHIPDPEPPSPVQRKLAKKKGSKKK